jgi:hypothetical protein
LVVHITQISTAILEFRALRDRKFDLVIARIDAPINEGSFEDDLLVEKLFDDRVVLATGTKSKWARASNVSLAELQMAATVEVATTGLRSR